MSGNFQTEFYQKLFYINMIIGVTGSARCGKDEVAKYISEKYTYQHLDFGADVLVPEVKKRNLEPIKENITKTAKILRDEFGNNVTGERMLKLAQGKDNLIITGFRIIDEVNLFRENFENFQLILISASPKIRYQRELKHRQISEKDFLSRDRFDTENFGMQTVFDTADYKIDNSSTLEELHKNIDKLMEKLK